MICFDCGKRLTETESYYYGTRCEQCERAWHDRLQAWRLGADDPELDEEFSIPQETRQ